MNGTLISQASKDGPPRGRRLEAALRTISHEISDDALMALVCTVVEFEGGALTDDEFEAKCLSIITADARSTTILERWMNLLEVG